MTKIVAPYKGYIYIAENIPVQLTLSWEEAIKNGGPDTPKFYKIFKFDGYFPPNHNDIEEIVNIVLVNFGKRGGSWYEAIAWAQRFSLQPTSPRHVFALAENYQCLAKELQCDPMYVVATETIDSSSTTFHVRFRNSKRECGVGEKGQYKYGGNNYFSIWYAFLLPPAPQEVGSD